MSTRRAPALIHSEIASQPECWRRLVAGPPLDGLPAPGERVLVIGCGTSLHVARAYALLREARGQGITDHAPASQIPDRRDYDAVLAISRSGTTTEVIRAIERLDGRARTVGVLGDVSSPVAELVDSVVSLAFADERAVVQTRFPTTALNLLRASLGENLTAVIRDGDRALHAELPRPDAEIAHVVFLGDGWTVGLADEAALKFRETAGAAAESYPAMEYRHGPLSAADEQTLVWSFDPLPAGLGELLAGQVGAQVEVSRLDPVAELVRVQRQAVAAAEAIDRDPDAPAHLDRSVILP